jgi:outer membrane protein assembly factor BamB
VFVTLIDGKVHALDAETGKSLWSSSVGSPLISSWNRVPDEDPETGTVKQRAVFPGVDGSLYSYRTSADGKVKLEVLWAPIA